MSSFDDLAARVVRQWVRRYTRGLDPAIGDARRAEIESDVWEHRREASAAGLRPRRTGLEIVARMVLGMPADLGWRRAMPRAEQRLGVESDMNNRASTVWWVPAAIVVSGLNLVMGIAGWDPGWAPPQPSVNPLAMVVVVVGVAGLTGVVLRNRLPKVSDLLMLSGAWVPLLLGLSNLLGSLGGTLGRSILNAIISLVAIAAGVLTIVGAIQSLTRRPALKRRVA